MPEARLVLEGVHFAYGGPAILDGIDLTIGTGERLAVLGPNGAGKSTLLRLLAGTMQPQRGRVMLGGVDLAAIKGAQRARQIAFVPQESRVAFDFTVLEIVLMGRSPRLGLLGIEGEHDLAQAHRALEFTGAAHLADRPISQLSSGERQRVLLARALAQEPDCLLLDEPTAFLDLGHQVRIHRLLEGLNLEKGLTVVFVSHDLNLAARYAARVILLSGGRLIADGPPSQVLTPDLIRSAYGVEARLVPDGAAGADGAAGVPIVVVTGPAAGGAGA